mgnify:CR=1 FL=1
MLSLFSDVMKIATRQERWNPPDYWNNQSAPRSNAQREREEAERRHRAYSNLGIR